MAESDGTCGVTSPGGSIAAHERRMNASVANECGHE